MRLSYPLGRVGTTDERAETMDRFFLIDPDERPVDDDPPWDDQDHIEADREDVEIRGGYDEYESAGVSWRDWGAL